MTKTPQATTAGAAPSEQLHTVGFLACVYVALIVLFSVLSPHFLTYGNIGNIVGNMAFIGIMAAAQTPLIISGGLDLSARPSPDLPA